MYVICVLCLFVNIYIIMNYEPRGVHSIARNSKVFSRNNYSLFSDITGF